MPLSAAALQIFTGSGNRRYKPPITCEPACQSPAGNIIRTQPMLAVAVTPAVHDLQRTRAAGVAIAVATIVSTIFVALDRSGGGSNPLEILQGIARLQNLKELVHAVAIASVCGYAFGYSVLARRLGLHRPLVLAGLVVYLLGCVAMIGATILDGFVTPHIAVDAISATPERVA